MTDVGLAVDNGEWNVEELGDPLAVTPVPEVYTRRAVVPKRFFSPPLQGRFKQLAVDGGAVEAATACAPRHVVSQAKGLRTAVGIKRLREAALAMPPPPSGKRGRADEQPTGGAGAATQPGGDANADVSGLDLLLFASEATPFKAVLDGHDARSALPVASPLGQLATLLATSPYAIPAAAQRPPAARKPRSAAPSQPPPPCAALSHASLHAAQELVATLAPSAACSAAARWLDVLAADLRARHGALRKSRGRLSRAHGTLCEGRASADATSASLLLRHMDAALAGEEAALAQRMRQVADMRILCGAPEGEPGDKPGSWKTAPPLKHITHAQASAAAAALMLTAAALSTGEVSAEEPQRTSSGSDL